MPILILILIVLLVFAPQLWVKYTINKYHKAIDDLPGTGGELAEHLVKTFDLKEVTVSQTELGDHYNPQTKMVGLSPDTFNNKSLSAIAIAAHEVGHAIQDQQGDRRMTIRTKLATLASIMEKLSSGAFLLLPVASIITRSPSLSFGLMVVALLGMFSVTLLQFSNLPLEWDASFGKALPILIDGEYITQQEIGPVKQILRAAAFTYVAAALASLLNIWRWLRVLRR